MKPFLRLEAVALPIAHPNCDTDQIIPARYLQKPRADDFGQYLFRDLRFRKDGTEEPGFVLNQPAYRSARTCPALSVQPRTKNGRYASPTPTAVPRLTWNSAPPPSMPTRPPVSTPNSFP